MHHPRAVAHGYVAVAHHVVRPCGRRHGRYALYLLRGFGEERLVLQPLPIAALLFGDYGIVFEKFIGKRFRHYIIYAVRYKFRIDLVRVHTQCHVGRKSPRCGGPGKNITVFAALYGKTDDGGIFLYRLVSLRHFVRGERGAAARTVGNYLMPLVQKSLFVHLLQSPPLRFDVLVVVRNVGIFHISPITYAVAHYLPFVLVLPHGFFALLYERLYAVIFYLLFAVKPERLFHFEFDG